MRGGGQMVRRRGGGRTMLLAIALVVLCLGVGGVSITKFRASQRFAVAGERIDFECSYSLLAGEKGNELILRRHGRVLESWNMQASQPQNRTGTHRFSYLVQSVRSSDEYTCTIRTTDERTADARVFLHVINVEDGEFESSWRRENCSSIVFSQSTPFIYPATLQAFCGVWMSAPEFPSEMGPDVPPKQVLDQQNPGYWLRCAQDCSFSSAAGKWKITASNATKRRIPERLEILDAIVYLDSLPSNTKTSLKCIYWAQAKNNEFIAINRTEFVIDEKFEHRCEELQTPDVTSNVIVKATEYDVDFCTSDWEAHQPINVEASCRYDRSQNFTIKCRHSQWRMDDSLTRDGSHLEDGEGNATLERWNTIVEQLDNICPNKKKSTAEKQKNVIPDDGKASPQRGNTVNPLAENSKASRQLGNTMHPLAENGNSEMVNDASPSHQTKADGAVSIKQHSVANKKDVENAGSFINISSFSSLLLLLYCWNNFMQ